MPQSLSKVYTHITFSTKNRQNLIDTEIEQRLFNYLGGICKGLDCSPVQVGGFKNHVHILCALARGTTQSILLEKLKKESSKWIKTVITITKIFTSKMVTVFFLLIHQRSILLKNIYLNKPNTIELKTLKKNFVPF
ncbi:MAG TPA: transposase [Draconibacterium sp.]|nr:transposase [Draconibacterium sp.]